MCVAEAICGIQSANSSKHQGEEKNDGKMCFIASKVTTKMKTACAGLLLLLVEQNNQL
jgi:hypothetical protein